ncbi:unnamed protein product [Clonostachys byssicola]|uniref:Aminotransferase class I/classII large domain-containing protein n=1 Tax=Clonostachys byssicola TaxID=160290 RepID=A0A9N9TYU0_9HYPO|nr:unnamed protein product [Clonostachys byssicola]
MEDIGAVNEETGREQYSLSKRGAHNCAHRDIWGPREKSMANLWSPENPDGLVSLLLAENNILHDEISEFFKQKIKIIPEHHLTYGLGPRGSRRLRRAAAAFVNDELGAVEKVESDDIIVTPGLNSAIESLVWAICDPGEGVLIPKPLYNGFAIDILNRNETHLVGVSYESVDGYRELDDLFKPDINRLALEKGLSEAEKRGIKIRALLISHPHNPLGRCYPTDTLQEFMVFCSQNHLHFISDEIYAKSVFHNPDLPNQVPFVSTASLSPNPLGSNFHHILYGASKDLCANGLRLGFLCTGNKGILAAMSSNNFFSWSPHVLQDVWAAMLEDKQWFDTMIQKKNKLMAEQYAIISSFFHARNIYSFPMNAGLFVWVDFRRLLLSKALRGKSDYGALRAKSGSAIYKQRETEIADICTRNGVQIAPGSKFESEEYGWFRITFTVPRNVLEEGLRRLATSLKEIEARDWE